MRYRESISNRSELIPLVDKIKFKIAPDENLDYFDSVVFAKDPASQENFVENNSSFTGHLFLEKPLSPSIESHSGSLDLLIQSQTNFSVAYIFKYLDWHECVQAAVSVSHLEIIWDVRRHPQSNWKSDANLGGGLSAFYFVHFAPLFTFLNIPLESCELQIEADCIHFSYAGVHPKKLAITLRSDSTVTPKFRVEFVADGSRQLFESDTPFGPQGSPMNADSRIGVLSKYLAANFQKSDIEESIKLEQMALNIRRALSK